MKLTGINGDRADAILHVLKGSSQCIPVDEIYDSLYVGGYDYLLPRYGRTEALQAVLRELERRGKVHRIKHGVVRHLWGLR